MRKLLLSLALMLLMAGLVIASEVTLVKYDGEKKAVTVKEGDVEKTYRLTDKTKVVVLKNGKAEDSTVDTAIKLLSNGKAKGKLKFEITTDKDTISELKLKPQQREVEHAFRLPGLAPDRWSKYDGLVPQMRVAMARKDPNKTAPSRKPQKAQKKQIVAFKVEDGLADFLDHCPTRANSSARRSSRNSG